MYWTLGCIYGATAVGFGAFGAHGLKKVVADPAKLASFATAAQYQVRVAGVFFFGLSTVYGHFILSPLYTSQRKYL
jgi:uncharacterized membrane protein YgdD (TMEM256/DUF423 family)